MAAPYTSVRRKTEDALLTLILQLAGSDLTALQKVKGSDRSELTTPRLEIVCDRSVPEVPANLRTGNFTVYGSVGIVTTYADTSRSVHSDYCAYVEDLFMLDQRHIVQLAKALDFTDYTMMYFEPGEGRDETDGTAHRSSIDFEVYCCPSDVPIPTDARNYQPEG